MEHLSVISSLEFFWNIEQNTIENECTSLKHACEQGLEESLEILK